MRLPPRRRASRARLEQLTGVDAGEQHPTGSTAIASPGLTSARTKTACQHPPRERRFRCPASVSSFRRQERGRRPEAPDQQSPDRARRRPTLKTRLSMTSSRITRQRLAPSAIRTASSRWRRDRRVTWRLETLAQDEEQHERHRRRASSCAAGPLSRAGQHLGPPAWPPAASPRQPRRLRGIHRAGARAASVPSSALTSPNASSPGATRASTVNCRAVRGQSDGPRAASGSHRSVPIEHSPAGITPTTVVG